MPVPDRPRINVVGTTGSGKTTMARNLARKLGVPHVELDALHWDANWVEAALPVFRSRAAYALAGEAWTVDGNYSGVRDIVWGRANMVVWLDYSLPVIMRRLTRRSLRRVITKEELWNGNRERWRSLFLSRDSLFLWALQTYWRRRKEYPMLLAQPEYAHLKVVKLSTPEEADRWFAGVGGEAGEKNG